MTSSISLADPRQNPAYRKTLLGSLVVAALIIICSLVLRECRGGLPLSYERSSTERQNATVERVIDGDSVILAQSGSTASYRLLAIDAPEISSSKHASRQAARYKLTSSALQSLGLRSKKRLQDILPRRSEVEIEFDVKPLDKYKRPLVYLYLPGKEVSVNELLLGEGNAWFFDPAPNNRFTLRLREASNRSKKRRQGLWQLLPPSP